MIHLCTLTLFHTQHANSLLLLIHAQVQGDLAITKDTCANICLLNYLNLFLKNKICQTCLVVCCCRQPKIKPILLKIYVVVRVKIVPTESIQPSFMLRKQGEGGGFSIMKTILRKTNKKQFKLKYQNQSREQTLVQVNIHHWNFTTNH